MGMRRKKADEPPGAIYKLPHVDLRHDTQVYEFHNLNNMTGSRETEQEHLDRNFGFPRDIAFPDHIFLHAGQNDFSHVGLSRQYAKICSSSVSSYGRLLKHRHQHSSAVDGPFGSEVDCPTPQPDVDDDHTKAVNEKMDDNKLTSHDGFSSQLRYALALLASFFNKFVGSFKCKVSLCCRCVSSRRQPIAHSDADQGKPLIRTEIRNPLYENSSATSINVFSDSCGQQINENDKKINFLEKEHAFEYYKLLTSVERQQSVQQLKRDQIRLTGNYVRKKQLLVDVVEAAKDYYSDPTEKRRAQWRKLRRGIAKTPCSNTDVRTQVSMLRDRIPFFTFSLISVQIMFCVVMCYRFGFKQGGVHSYRRIKTAVPTFLGDETFSVVEEPNPWMGPNERAFWVAGAAVALCMTEQGPNGKSNVEELHLGCCEVGSFYNTAGTTTQIECKEMTAGRGKWKNGVLCNKRISPNNYIAHVIKPCCTPTKGMCLMTSHEHCLFIEGIFHVDLEHCAQANCLRSLCRLTGYVTTAEMTQDGASFSTQLHHHKDAHHIRQQPADLGNSSNIGLDQNTGGPHQWWRLFFGVPFTFGILHLLIVVALEVKLMIPVEVCAGWHRVLIIFMGSAITGEMMACTVEPYMPHDGSTGGVAGFIGVAWLEFLQAWPFLSQPWIEAACLGALSLLFLVFGTLHLFSLAAVVTGGVVGAMLTLVMVPYITFGRRLGFSRGRIVVIGALLLVPTIIFVHKTYTSTLSSLSVKREVGEGVFGVLRKLDCVRYTSQMCLSYKDIKAVYPAFKTNRRRRTV